jgi:hypothetical protein
MKNLFTNLQAWINNGERIILAVDLNNNVTNFQFISMLNSIGLIDIITIKYSSTCSLAETHQMGSILIDSICISSSLSILRTGYYPVDQALSDCCAI